MGPIAGYLLPVVEQEEETNDDHLHICMHTQVPVKAGEIIIRQGDEGDRFYVVEKGTFEGRVAKTEEERSKAAGNVVPVYQVSFDKSRWLGSCGGQRLILASYITYTPQGSESLHPSFGELALIDSGKRAASVVALTDGALWALERVAFRAIFFGNLQSGILQSIRNVPVFQGLKVRRRASRSWAVVIRD